MFTWSESVVHTSLFFRVSCIHAPRVYSIGVKNRKENNLISEILKTTATAIAVMQLKQWKYQTYDLYEICDFVMMPYDHKTPKCKLISALNDLRSNGYISEAEYISVNTIQYPDGFKIPNHNPILFDGCVIDLSNATQCLEKKSLWSHEYDKIIINSTDESVQSDDRTHLKYFGKANECIHNVMGNNIVIVWKSYSEEIIIMCVDNPLYCQYVSIELPTGYQYAGNNDKDVIYLINPSSMDTETKNCRQMSIVEINIGSYIDILMDESGDRMNQQNILTKSQWKKSENVKEFSYTFSLVSSVSTYTRKTAPLNASDTIGIGYGINILICRNADIMEPQEDYLVSVHAMNGIVVMKRGIKYNHAGYIYLHICNYKSDKNGKSMDVPRDLASLNNLQILKHAQYFIFVGNSICTVGRMPITFFYLFNTLSGEFRKVHTPFNFGMLSPNEIQHIWIDNRGNMHYFKKKYIRLYAHGTLVRTGGFGVRWNCAISNIIVSTNSNESMRHTRRYHRRDHNERRR